MESIIDDESNSIWQQEFQLSLLILGCCIALIGFFSADSLIGAVMLRTFYFHYGVVVALALTTALLILIMHWAAFPQPIMGKFIGAGIFVTVAIGFLTIPSVVLITSLLSGFVISIGVYCFAPGALVAWSTIALLAWMRGWLRVYLRELLLIRFIVICCLIFTACYAMLRYVQSLDFNVTSHHKVDSLNYYSVSMTSISSGIITKIVEYRCNEISLYCYEMSP